MPASAARLMTSRVTSQRFLPWNGAADEGAACLVLTLSAPWRPPRGVRGPALVDMNNYRTDAVLFRSFSNCLKGSISYMCQRLNTHVHEYF